jgi:peptidoglycan hydrolase CwlO-like protein
MEGQNKPFIRLPVFWATLGFIILIVIGVEIGYLYKKELIYVHIKEIGTIINNYERLINDKETLIQSKNKDIAEIKEQYQSVLNEVKSSYQKLTFKQERQINELSKKLEAAETEIAFKSKNISQETDIGLRVNYLGQGADTERGIQ